MSKLKSQPKSKSKKNKSLNKVPRNSARKVSQKKSKSLQSTWSPVGRGEVIDIIAPASSGDLTLLEKACQIIKSWGYEPRVAEDLIKPQLYLSNTDEYRFQSLKKALEAQDSNLVWCLRGGYGSLRLLPFLDKLKKPTKNKILLGLSDITSLQIYFAQKWNWPSLHGPLIDRIGQGSLPEDNQRELIDVITGKSATSDFKLKALNAAAENVKSLSGSVIGGNLMVAVSTLGTPYQLQGEGKILFFEELSERGYRIDRCLQQLQQAGVFKKVKAVIFGEFLKCQEPDGTDLSLITLFNFFNELKVPAFHGLELGHGVQQRPLFFNTQAKISSMAIDQTQFKMLVYSPYEIHKPRK